MPTQSDPWNTDNQQEEIPQKFAMVLDTCEIALSSNPLGQKINPKMIYLEATALSSSPTPTASLSDENQGERELSHDESPMPSLSSSQIQTRIELSRKHQFGKNLTTNGSSPQLSSLPSGYRVHPVPLTVLSQAAVRGRTSLAPPCELNLSTQTLFKTGSPSRFVVNSPSFASGCVIQPSNLQDLDPRPLEGSQHDSTSSRSPSRIERSERWRTLENSMKDFNQTPSPNVQPIQSNCRVIPAPLEIPLFRADAQTSPERGQPTVILSPRLIFMAQQQDLLDANIRRLRLLEPNEVINEDDLNMIDENQWTPFELQPEETTTFSPCFVFQPKTFFSDSQKPSKEDLESLHSPPQRFLLICRAKQRIIHSLKKFYLNVILCSGSSVVPLPEELNESESPS
ncbi:MAG: hypothetical protein ACO3A2_04305 [Bdellovibrionia bacterium]